MNRAYYRERCLFITRVLVRMGPNETGNGKGDVPEQEKKDTGRGNDWAEAESDSEGMPVKYATTGSHPALTALAVALVIILALAVAAYGTLETDISLTPVPGATFPYTTTYLVVIPAGQQVLVAGVPLVVLHAGDALQVVVNGSVGQFIPGEPHTIARGTAQTSSLGLVLSQTAYQVDAGYQGAEGTSAVLSLAIMTSQKASSRLVKALLPTGVEITPGQGGF
jgi:hypothetical protein